jgi:hypothetical protein
MGKQAQSLRPMALPADDFLTAFSLLVNAGTNGARIFLSKRRTSLDLPAQSENTLTRTTP